MMRAVFLDRDGVICEEKNHLCKKEEIALLPRAAEAIRLLNENSYLVIVVSNQSVIARGICKIEDVVEVNMYMESLLKSKGAHIDKIYFCPHHPTKGIRPLYTIDCECRKPKPGMILQAKHDLGISDLSQCYIVGDKTSDIAAGIVAGCKTILVETGYGGRDSLVNITPHFGARDLYDAVEGVILKND